MAIKKVSIIGAGNVGATATYYIAEKVIAEIVMVDVEEGVTRAKALDFLHAGPIRGYDTPIRGTKDYADIVDSDVTGDWVAVDVVGSDVRITATDITGQTAVQAARSRLDVAGSRLTGRGGALVSRGGVKAIFSVSEAEGAHGHRYLHGYFALPEGQQL